MKKDDDEVKKCVYIYIAKRTGSLPIGRDVIGLGSCWIYVIDAEQSVPTRSRS